MATFGCELLYIIVHPREVGESAHKYTTHGKAYHFCANFASNVAGPPARNIFMHKIRQLREAIFSLFSNISQPNLAILLTLGCSYEQW